MIVLCFFKSLCSKSEGPFQVEFNNGTIRLFMYFYRWNLMKAHMWELSNDNSKNSTDSIQDGMPNTSKKREVFDWKARAETIKPLKHKKGEIILEDDRITEVHERTTTHSYEMVVNSDNSKLVHKPKRQGIFIL